MNAHGSDFIISDPATTNMQELRAPSLAILSRSRVAAPRFPIEIFWGFWGNWVLGTASGANSSPDYVALPLLATASALIGNSRWAQAWPTWSEPPILWLGSVGQPSFGKSSGASPVTKDVLARVEMHMSRDYPAAIEAWSEETAIAKAIEKQWQKDVARAVKAGDAPPPRPEGAKAPERPERPRASVSDATIESLASILSGQPKGLLHVRDELSGWLMNLGRYANGGSDRPFWLEAYVGGRHRVDRLKNPEPVIIPNLSVATFGTIQPERLADTLNGADDGLPSRFLWSWPEQVAQFAMPRVLPAITEAADRLIKLADLQMPRDADGSSRPSYTPLDDAAAAAIEAFGREMQGVENTAHGMMKSAVGKARGQALRLALVLEYLRWTGEGTIEPASISLDAMQSAVRLMRGYFLPMARRVLGDAAIPDEERNARTLATWIAETRPDVVNIRNIREAAHLPGLRETNPIKSACRYLMDAGWLIPASMTGKSGRPKGDFLVSAALWPLLDEHTKIQVRPLHQNPQKAQNPPPDEVLGIMGILGDPPNLNFRHSELGHMEGEI